MSTLEIQRFSAEGLALVTSRIFPDERGFFCERYKQSDFEGLGLPTHFVQDNFSRSRAGIVRGLHYQWDQPQGKLVTCLRGRIFDVAVDIRRNSKTFGQVASVILDGEKPQWFWIPPGFAHGFCVLSGAEDSNSADLFYKCTAEYNPKGESGICFDDKDLAVQWPTEGLDCSPRDRKMPSWQQYKLQPHF